MDISKIENIELQYLTIQDYEALKEATLQSYGGIPNSYWKLEEIGKLISIFPEGQVIIKIDGKIAGCALSIIVDYDKIENQHTYDDITSDPTFKIHDKDGDVLYGIDVFIKPDYRGLRLGRRLYDYRKELCETLNLKSIVFGGRMPNYHLHADKFSPKQYLDKVKRKEIEDPVLNFQMSNDFHPVRILKGYLEGDQASGEFAVLMEWDNIYYTKPSKAVSTNKSVVRLGLIQWQMRPYNDLDELLHQVEYFVDSVAGYRSDFAVFPEFFNAPLMAKYNDLGEAEAIRELAKYTKEITNRLSELAISYNINIISGSMPEVKRNKLYNVGYLCRRDGSVERYEKIHVTPDEAKVWGMQNGNKLKTFDTDCGKIGILICYDSEFPELSRLLSDEGMDILFVPFLTDTQNGYSRVRLCSQARAVENECYVAIAGSVGNLPNVHNMDIQYAQSAVFTPCDFSFPSNGIKAEATPNTEMILVADVNIDLLRELHNFGAVKNLKDRRKDFYTLERKKK
ncbi:bifunctional GNAT family N-acetyltransferase/carbon-nitrogen hydrolase family protein [Croceibacter atlanticus]|jgi:predicted amidohydrolase/GNAT superfamily N-acetyltransferase|uniref:Putative carbon-nitrogen hydrolase n=1 Tax=Croceibacter atlanticus (strain ATCC BAA-628 / JCM 21780 / CIP 108009 / IAM 15332 / KCTC 12090 / HTCC2559) TaxID=216432 RepID=A3U4M4_CROAH|nr:bifunctional GNAT family N-acetyltransferase/carbon-nitrogen hydrolase family protein [Croceibacter atlanticus]EAP87191.1 putative carbon-nitrogen hydrolase [Croceibacter atlanticus HTCC2559]MBW4971437.1 bifunctional GNAT family N-acetyltransferase/carbon-nitrogen hydrolase family protein [Croceibacter atlanticus]|tara:strand:- start:486 stop:2018 length:1533 start_codon:yes stop_codon:yes gene_type:complete